jgi:two-component system phosphate regulon sensor histidine kinase PhoR
MIPFALTMVLIVVVCGATIYWAGQRNVRLQQIRSLNRIGTLVQQWIGAETRVLSEEHKRQLLDASRILGTRITLVDGDGQVLIDTHDPSGRQDNHNLRPEIMTARMGRVGIDTRLSRATGEPTVFVAEALDPANLDGIIVRISYPRADWADFDTPPWAVLGAAVVVAALVMAGLGIILQSRWITPMRNLADVTARLTAGDWSARAEPQGADEMRDFSGKLNLVAAQAQKQLTDLRAQRADLQALVDALPDPILLSDARRRIILTNAPAVRLLEVQPHEALGSRIEQVVREQAILELFDSAQAAPTDGSDQAAHPVHRELRLVRAGQRLSFQAVATRTAAGGLLLVLRDVSSLAGTMQMKTDFVANASHELRTPIAAIKIAFETLREVYHEDAEQTEKCVGIIEGHLRRLEEMLSDLLDLSRVESTDLKPHLAPVRVGELLANLRSSMAPMARQKGLELAFGDAVADSIVFTSDARLLQLVLKNLVENSIKFTPTGGRITVECRQVASVAPTQPAVAGLRPPTGAPRPGVVFRVIDTGIGIPREHIDRVFERFYQVDAARSGSAGRGSGLGLAIVKHAIHALGGTVELSSEVGKGTMVTCALPLLSPSETNAS